MAEIRQQRCLRPLVYRRRPGTAGRVCVVMIASLLPLLASSAGQPSAGASLMWTAAACPPVPPPQAVRVIRRPRWLPGTLITEYFPVREAWFRGERVAAPGLTSRHRVDWLYGRAGLAMNGEGIGLDGRLYHFTGPYDLSWVNAQGEATLPCWNGHWTGGEPAWYGGGWRNARAEVTFPLATGGWSNGRPTRTLVPPEAPRFAAGPSLPLAYWKRVAVDPKLIPLGSRVFIPAYCQTPAHGWFTAGDVGGAIIGRHVDVYRAPPQTLNETRARWNQTIFVIPPGTRTRRSPRCIA